jgi:hypothetical protein
MRSLSTAAINSANDQNSGEVWLVLLTIAHPDILDGPIRLVSDMQDFVSRGNTYVALPFDVVLPGEDPDTASKATLRVDNVDRRIVLALRQLVSPPTVSIEVVLHSSPAYVEAGFYDLILRNAVYDADSVTAELAYEQVFVEPLSIIMTPQRFPGLF